MGGLFGIVSKEDCVNQLFYGTDYHSHLGTEFGGLCVKTKEGPKNPIHKICNSPFRTEFEGEIPKLKGNEGIGIISDYEPQPLIVESHLGKYAIVTVSKINNLSQLVKKYYDKKATHFLELSGGDTNPTELVATLIDGEENFEDGIENAQNSIEGSCSILLLTDKGIYAGRDKYGRTPVIIGKGDNGYAVTSETCAFPNTGFKIDKDLRPGEVVLMTPEGYEQRKKPGDILQICSFLWVYFGYPASSYEGINVEHTRYRCGAALAENDNIEKDEKLFVAGIPDSGTAHAIGYADKSGIRYRRPFVKYTPTWPRSFMPPDQEIRNLVGKMKLIPIRELTEGNRLLFCDDSIVRGTQLQDTVKRLFEEEAAEVHMRPACPPLIYGCKFLNFSRSKKERDLAARTAIFEIEGRDDKDLDIYSDQNSDKHCAMVDKIRERMVLTSLKYQRLDDMVKAIGLPKEKLCTYCWDGADLRK